MPFIGDQATANAKIKKHVFTATASQTAFTVASTASDELQVFLNGVLLKLTDDYTYTTSTVTLGSGATASDIVEVHVYQSFTVADAVKASGDTMTGELEVPTVKLSSNVIKASDGGSTITLDTSDNVSIAGDLKVGAIKASDGTAGISIADSTGRITVTETNPSITLGSNATFPAGHVLQVVSTGQTGNVVTTTLGDVVNAGIELTIGSGNKAFIIVTGWVYTSISGAGADRKIAIYKEVSGSDTVIADNQPGSWGETETQYARSAISGSFLDNTTGTVKYKVKVSSLGTSGTMSFQSNLTVFEVKG